MNHYTVTRQIAIDAGHRVFTHGSKCRHLHGHRYIIEATCIARHLNSSGEQSGMVLDFGFLKEIMLSEIDAPCDHGFLAFIEDIELLRMFAPEKADFAGWFQLAKLAVDRDSYFLTAQTRLGTSLYIMDVNPTAEQLAKHWFARLCPLVAERSENLAKLLEITVKETPNCQASYRNLPL